VDLSSIPSHLDHEGIEGCLADGPLEFSETSSLRYKHAGRNIKSPNDWLLRCLRSSESSPVKPERARSARSCSTIWVTSHECVHMACGRNSTALSPDSGRTRTVSPARLSSLEPREPVISESYNLRPPPWKCTVLLGFVIIKSLDSAGSSFAASHLSLAVPLESIFQSRSCVVVGSSHSGGVLRLLHVIQKQEASPCMAQRKLGSFLGSCDPQPGSFSAPTEDESRLGATTGV
jgi:hypothetical protein